MPGNLCKRLERIEHKMSEITKQEHQNKCNCGDPKRIFLPRHGVDMEVQLKAELALTCPVHGERRLYRLIWAQVVGSGGKRIPHSKMDPILEEYQRRYDRQSEQVPEDGAENV